ncbi:MAG: GTPase HflX, partial [Nitrospinota bacterium]
MLHSLCTVSHEIKRQIGLLINRQGKVAYVIVGTAHEIVIPRLSDYRVNPERLRGLRLFHTHLDKKGFTQDDLTDLAVIRLDLLNVVEILQNGSPGKIHTAHICPERNSEKPWVILDPVHFSGLRLDCAETIQTVENELSHFFTGENLDAGKRALLVSVTRKPRMEAEESVQELVELAKTNGVKPLDTVILRPNQPNRKYLTGKGQLKTLAISALTMGADTIIFNENLTPTQAKELSGYSDLFIMDRTQLILEIFGSRALSRDGKTKVELAQLKYALPRLSASDDSLSRIRGGIGLKGPGETKLEIGRRRIQDRITALEKKLKQMADGRVLRKKARTESGLPLISIVGYTNSGKSTLFNLLTKSDVYVEDKLFATLDTKSSLLSTQEHGKVVISDTVGFIRELPGGLLDAFRSTLEELNDADLLIHLADIGSNHLETNI